ncbi:MAG: hypothetical protein HC810_00935 [Acaryochloridaceae cyanobacterium RL_2_7]|nr:hypothetical protein [Acaryochloridaceae cyanobacterium RL_2_7]
MTSLRQWMKRQPHRPKFDPYHHCPLCNHGILSGIALMDALSCDFCRHIFSLDIDQPLIQLPILKIEDTAYPLSWQWTGSQWKAQTQAEAPLIQWLWALCVAIALIPSGLMSLAVYLFPATPHGRGAWFAVFWLGLTILAHLGVALWLLCEHYQWPFYQRLKLFYERQMDFTWRY